MYSHGRALLAYSVLAVAFTWPLSVHLATDLTGSPEGDTGIYVWNQWVFQRELLTQHANPYFTDRIFALGGPANLTLNNYTVFANLLALPFGGGHLIATFNIIYLALTVLSGFSMFLLARSITGTTDYEAFLAGAVFAWSPMLATRGAGHFSLVAAAPLPLFVLVLRQADRNRRLRDAALIGLLLVLAFWSDVYYLIYCLVLTAAYVCWRAWRVEHRTSHNASSVRVIKVLDALIVCLTLVVVLVLATGGGVFAIMGVTISVRELYTPVLLLALVVGLRLTRGYRLELTTFSRSGLQRLAWLALCAAFVAAVLLTPFLLALGARIVSGQWASPGIYWRNSPVGVDLLAMILPNPNHPLSPNESRAWLSARQDGYLESVASIPLTAMIVLCMAWRAGWKAPRFWLVLSLAFAWMALGPFAHIAGVNTYIPGPWTFLRFVPVLGLARNPARFAVLVMLAIAILLACAMSYLRRTGAHRPWLQYVIGAALLVELLPAPRELHSARIPAFYDRVRSDPRDVRVLELPVGIRDGTFSFGNHTARTQFYQTKHGKAVVGGGLSRVSKWRVNAMRDQPVMNALLWLSEGRTLDPAEIDMLVLRAADFLGLVNVGYVVIDHARSSPDLVEFATRAFRLEPIATDGALVLFCPCLDDTPKAANGSPAVRNVR